MRSAAAMWPLVDLATLSKLVGSPEQRSSVLHDVQSLLARAAMETPLMVCLDDLQWADSGTAAALRSTNQDAVAARRADHHRGSFTGTAVLHGRAVTDSGHACRRIAGS